jgi:hypothetical protein
MLSSSKQKKYINNLKGYQKKYLTKKINDLDESGTRLMVNSLLTDVLEYTPIEEVKTEYLIKGTYADYVIQIKGIRHFLVEVKAFSLELSEKHLRQAINYGANEGIEWALLTNGKQFELYKILFNKPIESRKVFSIDLSDNTQLKINAGFLQYLHKDIVTKKGLEKYWNRCEALNPNTIAGILSDPKIINFIRKILKIKFKNKFSEEEVLASIKRVFTEVIDISNIKPKRIKKAKKPANKKVSNVETKVEAVQTGIIN